MHNQLTPPTEVGPQCPADPPFIARMRFHQSWYRANVLRVPAGWGPRINSKSVYGNFLTHPDGFDNGLNFLAPHLFTIAKRRVAQKQGVVDAFRLYCNLLSSQPMCFNLFGWLVDDHELATWLIAPLLGGDLREVTRVALEFAPEPVKEYLNDRTAFDAFIEYTRLDGSLAFVGIETKLTESFSPKVYRSPRYVELTERLESPWRSNTIEALMGVQINQLWREHLLAEAMRLHPQSTYTSGKFLVISHPEDLECAQALAAYRALLKPDDDSFLAMPLEQLIAAWQPLVARVHHQHWLAAFRQRYLDLSLSEAEYQDYQSASRF